MANDLRVVDCPACGASEHIARLTGPIVSLRCADCGWQIATFPRRYLLLSAVGS